jgi:tetrapyrrole methylase family protein/MazG family protein
VDAGDHPPKNTPRSACNSCGSSDSCHGVAHLVDCLLNRSGKIRMPSRNKKQTGKSRQPRKRKPAKRAAKQSSKPASPRRAGAGPAIPITARDRGAGRWFEKLVALQARLRGPGGCPWDREQTHASLRKFLIEESYEVLDAMESGDSRHFASELGDLLLQVVFHSILAEETGAFTISDVIESVHSKMVRRHPHVFGNATANTSREVLKNWEQIKAEERAEKRVAAGSAQSKSPDTADSILGDIPKSLPASLEAYQLTRRAARVGFDWDDLNGIFEKIDEEKSEIIESLGRRTEKVSRHDLRTQSPEALAPVDLAHLEEEVGDLLFAAVNVARFVGSDPEIALKRANRKFLRRFQWMESASQSEGKKFADLPRERMEELWNLSKQREASKAGAAK